MDAAAGTTTRAIGPFLAGKRGRAAIACSNVKSATFAKGKYFDAHLMRLGEGNVNTKNLFRKTATIIYQLCTRRIMD